MSGRSDGHVPSPEYEASETRAMIDQGRRIQEERQEPERAVGLLTVMDQWLDLVGDREHEQIRPVLVREAAAEIRRLRSERKTADDTQAALAVAMRLNGELRNALEAEQQMRANYKSERDDLRSELERRDAALREIAAKSCGIPGHAVAVGCGSPGIARRALATGGDGEDDTWSGPTTVLRCGFGGCTNRATLPAHDGMVSLAAAHGWQFATGAGWRCPSHPLHATTEPEEAGDE